jgi:hypothetical protein
MQATIPPPELHLRRQTGRPRPDPLPVRAASLYRAHAPWALTAVVIGIARLLLGPRDLGLAAAGAGLALTLLCAVECNLRAGLTALHFSGGVVALAVLRSPAEAGRMVVPAGMLLVAALGGRAAVEHVRPQVAPLAGRLPWRFERTYRRMGSRFAAAGLLACGAILVAGPDATIAVAAVGLVPLALRVFVSDLLGPDHTMRVWAAAGVTHLAVLALCVPVHGVAAAAWGLVATEAVLLAGATLAVARHTGATPLRRAHLGALGTAGALAVAWAFPTPIDWAVISGIILGFAAGPIVWPRRAGA